MIELLIRDEATNLPQSGKFEFIAEKLSGAAGDLEQIQLTLIDNGPGLPSDAMRSIFDPFYVRVDPAVDVTSPVKAGRSDEGRVPVKSLAARPEFFQAVPSKRRYCPAALVLIVSVSP